MSPFLFSLIIDPILRKLENSPLGFPIGKERIAAMAYADDLLVMSDSQAGMQSMLESIETHLAGVGLQLNAAKTQYFGWEVDGHRKTFKNNALPPVYLNGVAIVPSGKPCNYLGLEFSAGEIPTISLEDIKAELYLVKRLRLKPSQRLVLLKELIIPKLQYKVAHTVGVLKEGAKVWAEIRKAIKSIMHLPPSYPTVMIVLPSKEGGLGVANFQEQSLFLHQKCLARLARMNYPVGNALLDGVLSSHLRKIATRTGIPAETTGRHELSCAVEGRKRAVRSELVNNQPNKNLFMCRQDKFANAWVNPSSKLLPDKDRILALRLRTNLVPTRWLYNRRAPNPEARSCRACGAAGETIFHISQRCPRAHGSRISRHDFLRDRLCDIIQRKNPTWVVEKERVFTVNGVRLRPDITVISPEKVFVLDAAIGADHWSRLAELDQAKRLKYLPVMEAFPDRIVEVTGMCFGLLGLTYVRSRSVMFELGLSAADVSFLSAGVIRGTVFLMNRFMRTV